MKKGLIIIVESVIMTQAGEMNQPWYGLIMKYDQPSAMVIIVKIERHILFLDPAALSRGSIHIRNYMSFATKYNDETEACQMFDRMLGETSRKPSSASIFRNTGEKIVYPAGLVKIVREFPIDDGQFFATAATRNALAQVYGTERQITSREKHLQRELDAAHHKRKKKKRILPDY